MVESIARVKNIRVTPQKARRVVDLIRGRQATEVVAILKHQPQAVSEPLGKIVSSAIANAQVIADRDGIVVNEDDLVITKAYVDEGLTLKRFRPRAQGRAFRINKRTSHITVGVATPEQASAAAKAPAKEKVSK